LGPGENACLIDIGDGNDVVLTMESREHPSSIASYQGVTAGVGCHGNSLVMPTVEMKRASCNALMRIALDWFNNRSFCQTPTRLPHNQQKLRRR
jgi:hypothetical protein